MAYREGKGVCVSNYVYTNYLPRRSKSTGVTVSISTPSIQILVPKYQSLPKGNQELSEKW